MVSALSQLVFWASISGMGEVDSHFACAFFPTLPIVAPPVMVSSMRRLQHRYQPSRTMLFSLKPLVEEIDKQISGGDDNETPVIFFGGKGGVGKTSISSSLAVFLASSIEHDWKVLIISTDPAHSLGDALDVDLRNSGARGNINTPIVLSDALTNGRLHALEVDPRAALVEFQSNLELFDVSTLSKTIGIPVSPQMLQELGLDELQSLIRNPPPGFDELVALANVLDTKNAQEYDVIIVDTAPTGHTLRMLQLPQFLDGFLQILLNLRQKLKGLIQTMQMFMGAKDQALSQADSTKVDIDQALATLEKFQEQTIKLQKRLKSASSTKFVVVTIPTILSVRESQRLIKELREQGVCVSDLVVNQCISSVSESSEGVISEAMKQYYDRRVAGQQRWISEMKDACAEVSKSEAYQRNTGDGDECRKDILVKEVPFYDVELVGVPALGYLGSMTYTRNDFERLLAFDEKKSASKNPKVVICGGKGGVGKTTTSSSLAITLANAGHNVVLVSTDPAHSLGDALDMNLQGGSLIDVPLVGIPPLANLGVAGGEGSLKVMEIDPSSSLNEFRDAIDNLIGKNNDDGNSEFLSTLNSLGELMDTLPAGTDEVVALAKVIQLIRRGNFDRVVLDTAPTGHTLRMLTIPSFLADLIERILLVSKKITSNAAIKLLLAGATKNKNDLDEAGQTAKSALLKFQVSMYDLEDLFADPTSTEFLIVTIPTELAVRESTRLLNELTFGDPDMPIRVRNVVMNQVLDCFDEDKGRDEKALAFTMQLSKTQMTSLNELRTEIERLPNAPRLTEVSYMDTEPRGVYGLKMLAETCLLEREFSSVG